MCVVLFNVLPWWGFNPHQISRYSRHVQSVSEKTEAHERRPCPGSHKSFGASAQTQDAAPRGGTCDCCVVPSLKHDVYTLQILKKKLIIAFSRHLLFDKHLSSAVVSSILFLRKE